MTDCALRLADHDRRSLGAWLGAVTGRALPICERAAAKALRCAFAGDVHGDQPWTDARLAESAVGRWARPALLGLSPRLGLRVAEKHGSRDGTTRLLLAAADGALIESVIIPASVGRDRPRTTLCISSQVGCARRCAFCETGARGLERQLSSAEIVDQFRIGARLCAVSDAASGPHARGPGPAGTAVSNVVFMGMGEPLDNLPAVARAIALLGDQAAFSFPPTRITVSTVGIVDRLEEFFRSTRAELAVSLNAPDDVRRATLMPVGRRGDLEALRDTLLRVLPARRRVLFQYVLIAGFNDAPEDAEELARYVRPIRCRVNVIPANPGPDPALCAPSDAAVDAFVTRLCACGVTTMLRRPRGRDVGGACGQLAGARRADAGPSVGGPDDGARQKSMVHEPDVGA